MHEQAFTPKAALLFPSFSRFKKFYLVGGTGLALQIGHRRSVDFDFFTAGELPENLLSSVKRIFSTASIAVTYQSKEQLNVLVDGIKTTFFSYPYPVIDAFVKYQAIDIASTNEIAAMKALSIGHRLSYKDYVDWYFLLKEKHADLGSIISLARRKFLGDFNDRLFLGQLVSLEDIPTQKIEFLRDAVDRLTIEQFLKTVVHDFKF